MQTRPFAFFAIVSLILATMAGILCVRSYWTIEDFKYSDTEFGLDRGSAYLSVLGKHWRPGLHHLVLHAAPAGSDYAAYRQWTPDFEFADTKFNAWFFTVALRKQHPGFWTFSYTTVVVRVWPIIFAAAIPMVLKLFLVLRANNRRSRQQCVHCGYDLRGSPSKCPECGLTATLTNGTTAAGTIQRGHHSLIDLSCCGR